MKSEHVVDVFECLGKLGSLLRRTRLIHHLIIFLISGEPPIVSESISTSFFANFNNGLTMFGHEVFFEGLPLLLIINILEFLHDYLKRVGLSELLTLEKSGFSKEICFEDLRILSEVAVEMLSHDGVKLP